MRSPCFRASTLLILVPAVLLSLVTSPYVCADDAKPTDAAKAEETKPVEPARPKKPAGPPAGLDNPKDFLHPPMECMKGFQRIDKFPLVGWCFHGKGGRRP